jgi:hypothetical protein
MITTKYKIDIPDFFLLLMYKNISTCLIWGWWIIIVMDRHPFPLIEREGKNYRQKRCGFVFENHIMKLISGNLREVYRHSLT